MTFSDDTNLLRDYATHGSEAAFETLVRRPVNLVYSAALRRVRDPVLAGEVTQTVFIILAKKAPSLRPETVLTGWLYRTAQLAAGHALRAAGRRRKHEEEAAQMQFEESETNDATWEQMAPVLEEAMAHLGEADRNVVLLRYFDNKDFKSVGAALGTNEDTAQKRASRALEKLRVFLTKRGVLLPAAAVAAALSTHAVQAAPAHIAAASIAAKGTAAASQTSTLLKGTLKLMAWTKLKIAAVAGVAILFAATTTTVTVYEMKPDLSWEMAVPSVMAFTNAKPQLTILPTKFGDDKSVGWRSMTAPNGQSMAIKATAEQMILTAYQGLGEQSRVADDVTLAEETYDYICSLKHGASNAIQNAIKVKFGLVASREMIDTNVLLLSLRNPDAPELKPNNKLGTRTGRPGQIFIGGPIQKLAGILSGIFQMPVIDETGLTGNFNINLTWNASPRGESPLHLEAFNQALLEEVGLELTPGIRPVEMLVIEKVSN